MVLEKEAFTSYTLDDEKQEGKGRTFTIRFSKEDDKIILELKKLFDIKSDSTMLKVCMYNYLNVLQCNFSPRYLKYLFKKDRQKLSDWRDTEG